MFALKWKKKLQPNIGRPGWFLGNRSDSCKKIENAAKFFTKRNITSGNGNVCDALNMAKSEKWFNFFEIIEIEIKEKL